MLTLTLSDPAATAALDHPVRLPEPLVAPLARSLNTVFYGYVDTSVDGAPETLDAFWLADVAPDLFEFALLNLAGGGTIIPDRLAAKIHALVSHARGEERLIDLVRDAPEGPELRLSDEDGSPDPRAWTYRRLTAALHLMGFSEGEPVHASDLTIAAARIRNACIESRSARDAERLGAFAETLMIWNDVPILAYVQRTEPARLSPVQSELA